MSSPRRRHSGRLAAGHPRLQSLRQRTDGARRDRVCTERRLEGGEVGETEMARTTIIHSAALTTLIAFALVGCASREPVKVSLAGVEPLKGAGMEARFLARLRVQNPNDAPIVYDGLSVDVELNGRSFASGVSDAKGEVARFGESLVELAVTMPGLAIVRQALGFIMGDRGKVTYRVRGFLNTGTFGRVPFDSTGEIDLSKPAPDGG